MKNLVGKIVLLSIALAAAKPCTGFGQDFFRDIGTSRSSGGLGPVEPTDYNYADSSSGLKPVRSENDLATAQETTEENDKYNIAVGNNLRFSIAAGVGIEYNDNITLAEHGRESDFIFRPIVNLATEWHISDLNTLRFNVGASYAAYFSHTQYDPHGILLSPNSEMAFTFYVASLKFTIRDRFSFQEDAYDIPQLSNAAIYARYENQAGIEMDWAATQALHIALGYDHYNLWVVDDPTGEYALQNRSIDTFFLKPYVQVNPALKVGLNASFSFIHFTDTDRSNGEGILAGPFITWQITPYTNVYLEGGYQSLNYDNPSNFNNVAITALGLSAAEASSVATILQDNTNSSSYYIKFELNNRPSEFFHQRLSFSKTAEIGFDSNFYELYNVEYDAAWKIFEHVELGPSIFYEHYISSGPTSDVGDRIGATIGIRYHFTNSLTLGLDYRYIWKNSNVADTDYYQNLVFLSLFYKF